MLDEAGVGYTQPSGAFYLMVDVSAAGDESELVRRLLVERHVAVVLAPFSEKAVRGWSRYSLAAADEAITTGLERLCGLLQ